MQKIFLSSWGLPPLAAVALLLTACAPGQDVPTPTASINVSRYLAVGDSYTAGYSAGGLTRTGQDYAFPNLLARQLRGASPAATFTQPLLEAGTGTGYFDLTGYSPAGFPRTRRVAGQAVRGILIDPNACAGPDTTLLLTRTAAIGELPQNLGVPGLRLTQIDVPNLGSESAATPGAAFNPYFSRLLPAADSRTYLQAVTTAASSATFFTFFQGLDDLLPYVQSGGTCGLLDSVQIRVALQNTMKLNAAKLLDQLTPGGQRPGIIAKLPALATLPLLRLGQGDVLQDRLQTSFGDAAKIYITTKLPPKSSLVRPITEKDYVLATALDRVGRLTPVVVGGATLMLPYGRDIRNPLRNADVLDELEVGYARAVVNNYNNELDRLATSVYHLPEIDAGPHSTLNLNDALFDQVTQVISVGGVQYSAEPVRGNFYSLDYYSLTPRGNGLLANAFITAFNKAYRANIPVIDVNSLPTTAH